jgi:hypothetical protein
MPQDRPDIMARVYRAKLRDLQDFLLKKHHLGKVAAWAHVTEFQKRGLPHEHFLLIMEDESKVPYVLPMIMTSIYQQSQMPTAFLNNWALASLYSLLPVGMWAFGPIKK